MKFNVNSPILYVIVGAIIALVLAQSAFFLCRALKRAKELGIAKGTIKKTISSAALFTVAPAIAVLVGVVALSKSLGVALPWLRLSVIGSITYETVAAGNALEAAGMSAGTTITDPSIFVTIAWVMTLGIAAGLVLVPFVTKKLQSGLSKIGMKPDLLVGDFDSLDKKPNIANTITLPKEKDETDTLFALRKAFEKNPDEIIIFAWASLL